MPVDVERLRVQGQAGEEDVVHLGDGAGGADGGPDLKILEIEPASGMPVLIVHDVTSSL